MIFISTLFYYTNYSIMDNNTTPDQFISSLPNELKLHIFEYLHIDIRLSLLLPYIHSIETVIRLHSSIHDFIIYYNQMHRNFRKLINHPSLKSTYYCRNFDLLNDYSSLTEHKHPIRDFLETILKTMNVKTYSGLKISIPTNVYYCTSIVSHNTLYNNNRTIIYSEDDFILLKKNEPNHWFFRRDSNFNSFTQRFRANIYRFNDDPLSILKTLSQFRSLDDNFDYTLKSTIFSFIIQLLISNTFKRATLSFNKQQSFIQNKLQYRLDKINSKKELRLMKSEDKSSKKLNVITKKFIKSQIRIDKNISKNETNYMKKEDKLSKKLNRLPL